MSTAKKITDAQFCIAAKEAHHSEGSLEIDDGAKVSRNKGGDDGAYVQAWQWVERGEDAQYDEGTLEVDENAKESSADGEHGKYVESWVWVSNEDADEVSLVDARRLDQERARIKQELAKMKRAKKAKKARKPNKAKRRKARR